jgi:hypothetical protein
MTDKLVVPVAGAPLTLGPAYGVELGALLTLGTVEGNGLEDYLRNKQKDEMEVIDDSKCEDGV